MKILPLKELHGSLEAKWGELAGWEVPVLYSDTIRENWAVHKGVGIIDLSYRGKIRVTGEEAATFLHNLVTNDIKSLKPGAGCYAAMTDIKARMLADMKIFALKESFLIDCDPALTEKIIAHFKKFIFRMKVKIADETDAMGLISLQGILSLIIVEKLLGREIPAMKDYDSLTFEFDGAPILMVRDCFTGEEGYLFYVPNDALEAFFRKVFDIGNEYGIRPVGTQVLEILRMEAGIPKYGVDMDESTIVNEAGIDARAIHYNKGCYVGQEIICRIHDMGNLNRHLVGIHIDYDEPAEPGDAILVDDQRVGKITSSVPSAIMEKVIALGYVRRPHHEIGTALTIQMKDIRRPAKVVGTPFYKQ